jgi:hypothetical protein
MATNTTCKRRGGGALAASASAAFVSPAAAAAAVLMLLLSQPARAQTASALSVASAAPGSSSSVSSEAVATEPGSSTVVVAVGQAPSGGQRVVVDCSLAATHASEQLVKYCEGVPQPPLGSNSNGNNGGNSNTSNSNDSDDDEARAWRAAPRCGAAANRNAKVVALDSAGRGWGREPDEPTGRLCAFREELFEDRGGGAAEGARAKEEDPWAEAPDCQGDPSFAFITRDFAGRAWGWENGASCAWREVKVEGGGR